MIRIASYNMKNLFDDFTSDGSSSPKPENEARSLVRVIDALRADIIAAQEVESIQALDKINDRLRTPFAHTKVVRGNSGRGIHLGFLSRFSFTTTSHRRTALTYQNGREMEEHASERAADRDLLSPLRFQRDCLLARFRLDGGARLALFNVHLKSQRDYSWLKHRASEIRAAEARAIARIVKSYGDARIVLGDFNEETGKPPIRPLAPGLGFYDSIAVEIADRNQDPHTYHPVRYRGRIDYILLSPGAEALYQTGSIRIHRSRTARRASDHYPISVKLRL